MYKKYIILLFIILLPSFEAFSEFQTDTIISKKILDNNDTLQLMRTHGELWFGLDMGANLGLYFGSLNLPDYPTEQIDIANHVFSYKTGDGYGIFMGLLGEYRPIGSSFGGGLKVRFLDYRPNNANTDNYQKIKDYDSSGTPKHDTLNLINESSFSHYYVSISPEITFSLGNKDLDLFGWKLTNLRLNVFGGIDLELLISDYALVQTFYVNSGDIYHKKPFSSKSTKFRMGAYVGLEYDIFVADVNQKARAYLSPFVSFHGGSFIFNEFQSSRNMILFRAGISAKLSLDKVQATAVKFNKDYEREIDLLTKTDAKPNRFGGFTRQFVGGELAQVVPEKQITQEIAEKPADSTLLATLPSKTDEVKAEVTPKQPSRKFRSGVTYTRNFDSPTAGLSIEDQQFLTELAEFLKNNNNFVVRIVGHTDNTGRTEQINLDRSNRRANQTVNYLIKKGISKGRLFERGGGSLTAIGDNRTSAGKRKNNRVEILIEQP